MANSMESLIKKIERRLGLSMITLPEQLDKSNWAEIIEEDTLETFSRYFPHMITYRINTRKDKAGDGYYYINMDKITGVKLLGVKDIDFESLSENDSSLVNDRTYMSGIDYVIDVQLAMNTRSLFNLGYYIQYKEPNLVKIEGPNLDYLDSRIEHVDIDIFVSHPTNLQTISPTKMGIFEKLAIADIKIFLYQQLKYFDNFESIFGSIDFKISDLESGSSERETIEEKLEESYVSAANDNQPIMIVV